MKKGVCPVEATDRKFLALDCGGRIKRFMHKLAGPRQDVSCDAGLDMWPRICNWCCVEPTAPPDQHLQKKLAATHSDEASGGAG